MKKRYRVEAQGDAVFASAESADAAKAVVSRHFGGVPHSLMSAHEIAESDKPEEEEWLE